MSKQSRRKSRRHRKPRVGQTSHQPYWYRSRAGDDCRRANTESVVHDIAARRQRTTSAWEEFVANVQEKAGLDELGLVARHLPNKPDVRIYDADKHRVAIVSDDGASVERQGRVSGDFLGGGDHWDLLHSLLAKQVGASEQRYEFSAITDEQITALAPAGASREMVEIAQRASRIIWERFGALAHPIELPGKQFSTVFWPAVEHNQVTGLPFEYRPNEGSSTRGRLCLRQRRDREIIPIAASSSVGSDELWPAWVIALCELAHFVETAEKQRGNGPDVSSSGESQERHLQAVSSAFVGAFVRRLPQGHHAKPQAIANAEIRGIELADGETLVTEHVRHGTDDRLVRIDGWIPSIGLEQTRDRRRHTA